MAKIVLTIQADNKATQSVQLLNAEVKTLSQTLSSIKVNKNLTTQINALTKHYKAVADAHAKIIANKNKEAIADEKLRLQEAKTATQIAKTNTEISKQSNLNARTEKTTYSLAQAKERATQATQKQTAATKANTIVNNNNTQSIGSMTVNIFKWQLAMTSVMKPLRLLQNAAESLGETLVKTEDRVVELQRVIGDVANANELYDLAAKYGQTFENVSEATLNFARRGMSWNESLKATEAALLAINVAELDVGQATDGLGAIMAQFGVQASELTAVVDMLNKTADRFPVTTSKILAGLQRTGSTASTANLTLEETIGLITTLSKATNRSGENIGTALNSILNIAQKDSTLETFSKLGDSVKNIVDLYRGGDTNTSILDVLEAVSKEVQKLNADEIFGADDFNGLNEQLKESMGEDFAMLQEIYGTAGTYRRNYFIALLNDLDTVKQVENEIADAQGYSQKENQKYLDTYTAKLNNLKAQWEDIANSEQGLLGLKKVLVDIGSVLLTVMKWTGGLRTVLLAVATVAWTLVGNKIIAGIKSVGTAIKGLVTGLKTATTVAQGLQAALGWIGVVGTALSLVIGGITNAISEYNAAQEEASRKAIERWQSIQDEAQQLEELSNKYKTLSITNDEYAEVEQSIIDLLGTKAIRLAGLSKGTEEYRKQVELLTGELKQNNQAAAQAAANAAKDLFAKQKYSSLGSFTDESALFDILSNNGFDVSTQNHTAGHWWEYLLDPYGTGGPKKSYTTSQINLSGNTFKDEESLDNLVQFLLKNGYGETDFYNKIYAAWEDRNNAITEYLKSYVPSYAFEDISSNEELDKIIDNVLEATNIINAELSVESLEDYRNLIESIITSQNGFKRKQEDTTNEIIKQTNSIKDATKYYDDLIKKLEELRDLNKEAYDWEEKKLAVLEAEQALENARNEATVRRFNESTGQWEWQTDEKAIKEAEENLQKAQIELEREAYDNIISQLEKGDAINESILAILQEVAPLLGADNNFVTAVTDAFKEKTGVDISQAPKTETITVGKDGSYDSGGNAKLSANQEKIADLKKQISDLSLIGTSWDSYFASVENGKSEEEIIKAYEDKLKELESVVEPYDSGGIANGLGFMAKATNQPESVNDPELTRKILTPVSNAEFDRYVKDMGIMFETARQYSQRPIIERVGGNTDNRVDNSGQINFAGGLTVGADKRNSSIDEMLSMFDIVPNN